MFERFRPDARRAVIDAQAHARRLGHGRIGTEHLLLALVSGQDSAADLLQAQGLSLALVEKDIEALLDVPAIERDRTALAVLGIDVDAVRGAAESAFGPGAFARAGAPSRLRRWRWSWPSLRRDECRHRTMRPDSIPFTPRAKKCLELSLREALRLRHDFISAEHIALGIVREGEGLACAVLAKRRVSLPGLRAALEASLRAAA
jgi:ATP-dependent Clp protease ATP-binding subunit ClpA